MAYQFMNAARECSIVKHLSTRLLLMTLASAVDVKTGTGFWSAGCLMHWSQLSKGAFYTAVAELESLGILKRERRRKGNRTNLWTLDIKKMESMRVSWQDIKPKDSVPEGQDDPTDDAGQGVPRDEEVDEMEIIDWTANLNKRMKQQPGSDGYFTLSKIQNIVETNGVSFARVKEVIEAFVQAAEEGTMYRLTGGKPGKRGVVTCAPFCQGFANIAARYDKALNEQIEKAFAVGEDI